MAWILNLKSAVEHPKTDSTSAYWRINSAEIL